jgi:MFS family permease
MGISVLSLLRDHPDDAPWLSDAEKHWLDGELERDRNEGGASETRHLLDAFKMPMVWVLAGIFFLDQIGIYTVNLWMPLVLNSFLHAGSGPGAASLIARYATVPYVAAAIVMVVVGRSSDRTEERRGHIAGCMLLAAAGFGWAAYAHSLGAALCAMTLATAGYWSIMGPFWALPTRVLGGQAAAGGVAIITMVGGIGGFLGPYMTGRLRDLTHGFQDGLLVIGGLAVAAAGLCFVLKKPDKQVSA